MYYNRMVERRKQQTTNLISDYLVVLRRRTSSSRLLSSQSFPHKNTIVNNKGNDVNTLVKTPTTMKHANTNACPTDTLTAWMKIKAKTMITTGTATTKLSSILRRL